MTYGTIKVDTVTFTNAGVDKSVTLSGLVQNPTFSGNVTVTGTLSGVTVTGTTANFTSGNFTNISGGTHTITSGVFAAGSAASPSITFTGDLNTGIYSPGADQVAISTGGSGRLFVDASGAVTVPTRFIIGTANNVGGLSETTRTTAGVFNTSRLLDGGTNPYLQTGAEAGIVYFNADGSSVPPIVFRTGGGERLRITSAGLVGVGTSSPSNLLEVSSASNSYIRSTTTTNSVSAIFGAYTSTVDVGSTTNHSLNFYTAGVNRATLDTSGRLGVGTTSPGYPLDVQGESGGATLRIRGGSGGSSIVQFTDNAVSTQWGTIAATSGSIDISHGSVVRFLTNSSERFRIDSSGRVGIGTSSPGTTLDVIGTPAVSDSTRFNLQITDSSSYASGVGGGINFAYKFNSAGAVIQRAASIGVRKENSTDGDYASALTFHTTANGSSTVERLRIDSSGRVGIGTTSPGCIFHAETTGAEIARLNSTAGIGGYLSVQTSGSYVGYFGAATALAGSGTSSDLAIRAQNNLLFTIGSTERARIDSSGRLLVGTSSARGNFFNSTVSPLIQQEGISGSGRFMSVTYGTASEDDPIFILGKHRGASIGGNTVVANGDGLGKISFQGSDGSELVEGAAIRCEVDGTPGANDMPGRLVFSTTADGASSPTERMRIDNAGSLIYGTSTSPGADITSGTGFYYQISTGFLYVRSNGSPVAAFNRGGNDGTLVEFKQDQTTEGTISVSGTTVSYNGAHLSRWSQLPSGQERTEILRGTVLSNIDEMCEWGEEDNEQLNRMKVSDVEGDKNVSGVFQAWDDDDNTYTNDFYCAMTGDFIIRIAAGVTVERGDLLMSTGDGTAKPQDDDIIRSKTIAKVTSTNVSCTYDDGSYCVPCVLMAC